MTSCLRPTYLPSRIEISKLSDENLCVRLLKKISEKRILEFFRSCFRYFFSCVYGVAKPLRRLAIFLLLLVFWSGASFAFEAGERKMKLVKSQPVVPATQFWDGQNEVSLSSLSGRYVLVNFWATWCAPCVRELPSLERLTRVFPSEVFTVVAVSQDQGGQYSVVPFLKKLEVSGLTIWYDTGRRSFKDFGIRGLPTTVLLSPDGRILAKLEGEVDWDRGAVFEQLKAFISQ